MNSPFPCSEILLSQQEIAAQENPVFNFYLNCERALLFDMCRARSVTGELLSKSLWKDQTNPLQPAITPPFFELQIWLQQDILGGDKWNIATVLPDELTILSLLRLRTCQLIHILQTAGRYMVVAPFAEQVVKTRIRIRQTRFVTLDKEGPKVRLTRS